MLKRLCLQRRIFFKDNVDYKVYRLTKIDSNGVFYKYRVEDFEIEDIRLRYYNITAIYRPFISGVDKQAIADKDIVEARTIYVAVQRL